MSSLLTATQLAFGVMAFALALTVLVGRWVTGEEYWLGVVVRGAALLGLLALALSRFGTVWYWVVLPLAMLPMVDAWPSAGAKSRGQRCRGDARVAAAMSAMTDQPANPMLRLDLARGLLETGQIEAGLASLDEAANLAAAREGYSQAPALIEEVRREFVRRCPRCGHASVAEARVCRHCWSALVDDPATRAALWLARPLWQRWSAHRR